MPDWCRPFGGAAAAAAAAGVTNDARAVANAATKQHALLCQPQQPHSRSHYPVGQRREVLALWVRRVQRVVGRRARLGQQRDLRRISNNARRGA